VDAGFLCGKPIMLTDMMKGTKAKVKGKFYPRTGYEAPDGEQMYSSTLSLTSALDGVGGQHYAPATLVLGKTLYPLCRRLVVCQGRSEWVWKISPTPAFDPQAVQPVASRYSD
jgi:hypothetical protein